jgi:16S rRNA (cytidine(1402)-2'-O)-methyltransferase
LKFSATSIASPAKTRAKPKNSSIILKSRKKPSVATSTTSTSRATELIQDIKAGKAIALVSDAGTPGVSDPGSWLVREAIAAGVPVFPIPGANAAISALIASGFSPDEFEFLGFLPEKAGARRTQLEDLAQIANPAKTAALAAQPHETPRTLIFYEAPHRLLSTLADFESVWGPQLRIVVARELTKIHEEFLRGTVADVRSELAARDRIRGEITLLIEVPAQTSSSAGGPGAGSPGAPSVHESIAARVARMTPKPASTRKKRSSGWPGNSASPRARSTANSSASAPSGGEPQSP